MAKRIPNWWFPYLELVKTNQPGFVGDRVGNRFRWIKRRRLSRRIRSVLMILGRVDFGVRISHKRIEVNPFSFLNLIKLDNKKKRWHLDVVFKNTKHTRGAQCSFTEQQSKNKSISVDFPPPTDPWMYTPFGPTACPDENHPLDVPGVYWCTVSYSFCNSAITLVLIKTKMKQYNSCLKKKNTHKMWSNIDKFALKKLRLWRLLKVNV